MDADTAQAQDAEIVTALMSGLITAPYLKSNEHAIFDRDLPAIVRGFLAINAGNATETLAIEEAGFMPTLYGRYKGKACRVVMVSSLGDVGISFVDQRYGYSERVSIYDLDKDAFSLTRPTDLPDAPPQPVYTDHGSIDWIHPPLRRRKKKLIKSRP
uniref:Uncharacterized protein n=1 Tax=Caulobacter phage BL57 TaxID=3348355 RepID=A0AB74UMS4_9VIRU